MSGTDQPPPDAEKNDEGRAKELKPYNGAKLNRHTRRMLASEKYWKKKGVP